MFVNGDFEADAIGAVPTGWTVQTDLNPQITDTRPNPQTLASLNLASGGYAATFVVGGATESQTDPTLGSGASLRYPRYGTRATRINYKDATNNGTNNNVNVFRQTMTTTNADVDISDNKVHVRAVIAPVLENPSHGYVEQPYYFVRLQNITKNLTLFQDFNASAQPGVPWKTVGTTYYTDWQLIDIFPGNSTLAVGDQVELQVIAAGCSRGGHWGRVYVDGGSPAIPGIFSWATGPQAANSNSNITYVVNYRNTGSTTTTTTKIDTVLPANTTFQSVSLPGACTAPAVGGTGTVSCTVGTLVPGASGSFTLTVKINAGATGTITNGNYYIYATGVNPLLGPKVQTTITSGVTYADVAITKSNGVAAVGWGQAFTYTIRATNNGPSTASSVTVADAMPAQLTGVTWTCAGAGGGSCTASGSGNINDAAVSLPVGATATYTVSATVVAGSGSGSVTNTATATVGGAATDPDTTNNTAVDTDSIGPLRTLSLTKTGPAGGTVGTAPAAISCGTSCSSASGQFVDGTAVVLTASAVAGGVFSGWGGACASAGTSPTCNLTMNADKTVTAAFVPPPTINVAGGNNQNAALNAAFAQPLQVLVVDSGGAPISGATVVFSPPASGASATLSSGSATTNASGLASVTATANATAGAYVVNVGISGTAATATFSLSNYGSPASVTVVSGSGQSATVATAFAAPLVVVVRDAASQVVPTATVTFAAPASGPRATLGAGSATTNGSGQASVTATAGTAAGSYTVTASVAGVATPASFTLTNTAGSPAQVVVSAGGTQTATVGTAFGSALQATVRDAYGNPVAGATVTFAAPASGATATLGAGSATTNAAGQASVTATAGTVAGSYNVTASVAGVAAPASFALTNAAGSPATVTVSGGSGQSATVGTAFASALVATVRDTYGNALGGVTVTFAAPSTGPRATLGAGSATTNAAGQASVTATAGTVAGSYAVTASVASVATPASFALANTAGAAASVTVSSGSGQSAPAATAFAAPLTVTVADAYGNPVAGASVTFTAPASGATATLGAGTVTTNAAGQASVTATAGTGTGTYTVTASVTGVAATASFTLTNLAGAAASVTAVSGGGQSAQVGTAFAAPLVVVVRDAYGNLAPGVTVTFTGPGAGASATFGAGSATTGATGQAGVTATANATPGSYSAAASVSGVSTPATFALRNYPALALAPASPTVAPRGSLTFTASGGPGSSYTYALATNASGGSIAATTGVYTAGPTANVTDIVRVTDGTGSTATANVTVGPGVSISPPSVTLPPHGTVTLIASGGSGSGYLYSVTSNQSGASIDASGKYTAGATGGVTDVVTATDPLGNSATRAVTVTGALAISAAATSAPPRGSVSFSASGGSGSGYTFSLGTNASGATVNPTTGAYVAGPQGNVTDVVMVTDALGNVATANISVGPGISVSPAAPAVPPGGSLNLVATGGSGTGFAFALTTNASGATINATTGAYRAGASNGVDVVTVTDSLGNSAIVQVSVGGRLTLAPPAPTLAPRQAQTFTPAGGSGTGVTFALTTNGSGGTLNGASGAYVAGATANTVDVVTATDSLGNTATATITVGAPVQITPASTTRAPLGRQMFSAAGGSGSGYAFSLASNASGGSINAVTGAYVAGPTGNVVDLVTVTDSLGNSASAQVPVGAALQPAQGMVSVAPLGTRTLGATGGAGGYTFALTGNGSGGSVDPTTGVYRAGSRPSTTDLVTVTDANGATTVITISVGAGVSLAPASPAVATGGALTFTAGGGSGSGYGYALVANGSGGSIDATSGAYFAGPTGNATDVVRATDSLGNTASVTVSVGGGLALNPGASTVPPRGPVAFSTVGGSGSGYVYALTTNQSGASIDAASGAYQAGPTPAVTDVVTVTDALGNSATASVRVGAGLMVAPPAASTPPGGTVALAASGGSGAGYTFAVTTSASGGTVDATGKYTAGATPSVTDSVTVTDALGNTALATIQVGAGITVTAASGATPPRGSLSLSAAGGSGSYTFALRTNGSGATVAATSGLYRAGARASTTDVVEVTDTLGNVATFSIAVGTGVSLTPAGSNVQPAATVAFSASGGSGTGFRFALGSNESGGAIDATSGAYTAGTTSGAIDVVTVTDSLGNTATAEVGVGNPLRLGPADAMVAPRGPLQLAATGGGGGYTFALVVNASAGSIDAATGLYTAGPTANVTDRVRVTDALGKSAMLDVTVGPGVTITPAATSLAPAGTVTFAVAGGSGAGYTFALTSNGSGGAVDAASGRYRAGGTGEATDVVTVTDALGNSASATVTVGAALAITPPAGGTSVAPRGASQVTVSGGAGGYTYTISSNGSGGSINPATGEYTAGAIGGTTDVITVTDANGVTRTITFQVGPGVSIGPADPAAAPGGGVDLTATGGSGTGYTWRLVDGTAGGTIDPATGRYTAPASGAAGGTVVVEVTDSLGNTARVTVHVTAPGSWSLAGGACTVAPAQKSGAAGLLMVVAGMLALRARRPRRRRPS